MLAPGTLAAQEAPSATEGPGATTLPEIHVIATTPVAPPPRAKPVAAAAAPAETTAAPSQPGVVDQDKIPSNVQTLSAADFSYTTTADLLQAMERSLPGVALGDQTGNEFQRDINYRGFSASPVIGTPQGLAIYQNGVRINEVFGDTINWDLIPENAINGMTLVPSNPIYGLNAIGGALSMQMKNGFTYHGVEGEVNGGSYGRLAHRCKLVARSETCPAISLPTPSTMLAGVLDSPSSLRRVYTDLGARGDQTEFHVTFTGADNNFGATAATPVQMLAQNWSSVYTNPQTTQNQLAFLTASASVEAERYVDVSGQCLFSQFSAKPCRRQWHRRAELRVP